MNKILFEQFLKNTSKEEIVDYYFSYGDKALIEYYGLSHGNFRELRKIYNLYVSKEEISKKKTNTWKNKADNKFDALLEKVPKNNLIKYYIEDNHTYKETLDYFNITNSELLKLLRFYNCKKPKSLSSVHCKISKEERHGDPGYNNREKAANTCIERYGVDNPFKDIDNIKKSYIEHLGVDHPMRSTKILQKQRETATKNGNTNLKNGSHGINSGPNLEFKKILDTLGLIESDKSNDFNHYKREFMIDRFSYDFKINDYLIEINPVGTHNSTSGIFGPKEKDYHFNKSVLAWNNGYKCIHVWDWDNKKEVINNILLDNYNNSNDLDKCIYSKDISLIKENYYIWNIKDKKLVDVFEENCLVIYGVGKL